MSREESHTALLVAAEALLRAADYPACRGLPAVTVPTTLLGQLAGAVASVVDGEVRLSLDCKTPKCPQARSVVLKGPTPEARHGGRGLAAQWYCGSCETVWNHWERIASDSPHGHQEGQSAVLRSETENPPVSYPEGRTEPGYRNARGCLPLPPGAPSPEETIRRLRDADEGPPGVCAVEDCWRGPITPGGVCHFHSEYAQQPHPWEVAQLRAGVFAVLEEDHEPA